MAARPHDDVRSNIPDFQSERRGWGSTDEASGSTDEAQRSTDEVFYAFDRLPSHSDSREPGGLLPRSRGQPAELEEQHHPAVDTLLVEICETLNPYAYD